MKYFDEKNSGLSQDWTPDFSVAVKCLTYRDMDISYSERPYPWPLSDFIIRERDAQQINVSKMRR